MRCLSCNQNTISKGLNIGNYPPASHFLKDPELDLKSYNISIGQCLNCGLIQLVNPLPHTALIPPYDWLVSSEPEEHLDDAVERILANYEINDASVIAGVSYKDDSTIERFRRKGFENTWRLDIFEDLKITDKNANIETIQKFMSPNNVEKITRYRGRADLLIVRHILEHAENIKEFLGGVMSLANDNGLIMFEVPDCTNNLKNLDYCMIWEEHSLYLTPKSLEKIIEQSGLEALETIVYPRHFENSIVLIARKSAAPREGGRDETLQEINLFNNYTQSFLSERRRLRGILETSRNSAGPIAIYGAGHLAHIFVNSMDVKDLISFVVDDTPQKQGLFLSGCRLPIVPSAELVKQKISVCLLALSINIEERIIERNNQFINNGGSFRSIFRESSRSIFHGQA